MRRRRPRRRAARCRFPACRRRGAATSCGRRARVRASRISGAIAGLAQLPGQHHAGDAGADDDDPGGPCRAAAPAARRRRRGPAAAPSRPWCWYAAATPPALPTRWIRSRRDRVTTAAARAGPRPACRRPARRAHRRSARPAPRRVTTTPSGLSRSVSQCAVVRPVDRGRQGQDHFGTIGPAATRASSGATFRSSGPMPPSADSVPPST